MPIKETERDEDQERGGERRKREEKYTGDTKKNKNLLKCLVQRVRKTNGSLS